MGWEVAEAIAALDELVVSYERARDDISGDGAEGLRGLAQVYAPKRTGRLASGITITRVGPASHLVGPTAPYGRIRELGGEIVAHDEKLRFIYHGKVVYAARVHQEGTHYLRRAVTTYTPRYQQLAYDHWLQAQSR